MTGFLIAVQFLTRLPTPRVRSDAASFAASMRWFPAVGLLIGGLVAAGGWAGGRIDSWTGALVSLVLWVIVTGALHLDGLADIADARGAAHKDRDRLLAVLADPHAGSFGVVAVVIQLVAKLVLLHGLIDAGQFAALVLIPFAARIAPLVWTRWLPSLHDGLAARFRSSLRGIDLALWSAVLIATAPIRPVLLVTPLLILAWGWWLRSRIGGISGDGHGAGIELAETGLLFAALIESQLL